MQEQRIIRTHDFNKSIKIGNDGEQTILKYLRNHPKIKKVKDVSKIAEFRDIDIDYCVEFITGKKSTIELKTDTYTSGNIFYETMSNMECNVPGCMVKSQAEFLFYYFTKTHELYIIKFAEYKIWFEENKPHFTRKLLKNINKQRNGKYTSEGYTIPKTFFESNFKHFQKLILQEE